MLGLIHIALQIKHHQVRCYKEQYASNYHEILEPRQTDHDKIGGKSTAQKIL